MASLFGTAYLIYTWMGMFYIFKPDTINNSLTITYCLTAIVVGLVPSIFLYTGFMYGQYWPIGCIGILMNVYAIFTLVYKTDGIVT